jgi:hypothetical protein
MSAFSLLQKFHADRADLNAIMDAWIEVSTEKGWPLTEEGVRRYLARLQEFGSKIPRRASKTPAQKTMLPVGFAEWWDKHPHSGTISVHVACQCASYVNEWEGKPAYEAKQF